MRIVFAGSAALGLPALRALQQDPRWELAGLITQPDRPRGRALKPGPCPVKDYAQQAGLQPVLAPEKVNAPESVAAIRACRPDLMVVIAYGQILKPELLQTPARGCVNVHASLLPAYRGAAPIQWAIARGERETGVTVMFMNERMDAGDLIARQAVPIGEHDTAAVLHDRLAEAAVPLLLGALTDLAAGRAARLPQDEALATYAPKLKKEDGRIRWTLPACELYNHIRGFYPWPCCGCTLPPTPPHHGGRSLRVLRARLERGEGAPGTVLETGLEGPLVATGDGALRLLEVQPEGRKAMSGGDFLRGYRLKLGERLE